MFEMKICLNCKAEEKDKNATKCKSCNRESFEYKYSDQESDIVNELKKIQKDPAWATSPSRYPKKKEFSKSIKIAIESANIVNSYGSFLQIIGIVVGVFWIILGIIASKEDGLYVILGLTIGGLTIAISVVQGAFLRMISNYVKAKLEIASSNN